MAGTPDFSSYVNGRVNPVSELIIWFSDAQKLLDKYGDSKAEGAVIFEVSSAIGCFVDVNGKRTPTRWSRVSYSKTGAYITPLKPRQKG